jgi:hypothetical protein
MVLHRSMIAESPPVPDTHPSDPYPTVIKSVRMRSHSWSGNP